MSNDMNSELIAELKSIRSRSIDISSFREWVAVKYKDLQPLMSPGLLMKLKRGNERQVLAAIASLLPSCPNCRDIFEQGSFLTRGEYAACISQVTKAVQNRALTQIGRPTWFHPDGKHFGADAYYTCNICDAIWTLVMPEREDNGLWERIV